MNKGRARCLAGSPLSRGKTYDLAHASALDEVDDRQQHYRADDGDDETAEIERLNGAADADQRSDHGIAENGADDADDDIPEDAHRGIASHHHARQPAGDAADDDCDNPAHTKSSCSSARSRALPRINRSTRNAFPAPPHRPKREAGGRTFRRAGLGGSVLELALVEVAVMLDPRDAQA